MQIDTGACKTVIHEDDFKRYFGAYKMRECFSRLKTVSGDYLPVCGKLLIQTCVNNERKCLELIVIKCEKYFTPLLGRDWLAVIYPNWRKSFVNILDDNKVTGLVQNIDTDRLSLINEIQTNYKDVFKKDRSSHIKNMQAKLKLKDGAIPIFHKAYSIPYAMKEEVERELLNLEKSGIIKRVQHSEWASPIVLAKRNDRKIRVCVDYKVTVNKMLDIEHYPLPLPEDIFNELSGAGNFCVLDLSGAYQQLLLDEHSREYLTINTHLGLFQPTRLQFGISSGPSVFQYVMDQILKGIKNVKCFIDDLVIHGTTRTECYENVKKVLDRLREYNVRVNLEKCQFFCDEIKFLGHLVGKDGIKPMPEKIHAIINAPTPKSISQLQSFLGLINYYGKFIPRLSEKLAPLYNLLKNKRFEWSEECNNAFQNSKNLITNDKLLVHYDSSKEIYVTTDASNYGVGAVLSHKIDGEPIYFASSTLNDAQRNYSQVEKEALAIIFAVQRFHKFLYGRKFILVTDHQPLKFIFDPLKKIPVTANARLQRWALLLSGYQYVISYRKGKLLGNADALSRLPLPELADVTDCINYFNFSEDNCHLDSEQIALATQEDSLLSQVYKYVEQGWPNYVKDKNLKSFFNKRSELTIEQQCILWGSRVIVPLKLREKYLNCFHQSHNGIVQTKMLIRNYCWWPGINEDIERLIAQCDTCQASRNYTNSCPTYPWTKTNYNFERIHIDFFMKNNITYLLIVDSHSKWIDIHIMNGTSASQVIEKLCKTFAIIGLPTELVSDNGPPFTSHEFIHFLKSNGIRVLKSPPYHPQSNGVAERMVQTVKNGLSRLEGSMSGITKELKLQNFLFMYRNIPNCTGMSPNEIIFKYKPKIPFDLMKPQKDVKTNESIGSRYQVGEMVWCKSFDKKMWVKGVVSKCLSPVRYLVIVNGIEKCYHGSSLRKCCSGNKIGEQESVRFSKNKNWFYRNSISESNDGENVDERETLEVDQNDREVRVTDNNQGESMRLRRSARVRKPPDRLNL